MCGHSYIIMTKLSNPMPWITLSFLLKSYSIHDVTSLIPEPIVSSTLLEDFEVQNSILFLLPFYCLIPFLAL